MFHQRLIPRRTLPVELGWAGADLVITGKHPSAPAEIAVGDAIVANGNVNPFELPGGYEVTWTRMQVLKHDGTRHHGVGIEPTTSVEPTAQGIADGRDEVLEKAVETLQAQIGGVDQFR